MQCKICKQNNSTIFSDTILNKYKIEYFHCSKCGFLQTEEPYWLDEAYEESINISDTGYMQRNIYLSNKLTILLFLCFDNKAKYIDYAGGYGVFVRLMRDIGFDFYWDDKFTKNLFAQGFESENILYTEAITTFESFEHFEKPLEEIEKMLNITKNIIFTTELLSDNIPEPSDWWYYGLEHGQHISFYSETTLKFIAKKYNLNYISFGSLHLFTENKISKFKLNMLRFERFGFHKLLEKCITSKTWSDHLSMKKI
ncbi:MAG: methyltransferase domain-containing protein [Helicobacteraceae bacterium]|nr:methyltransferase domain-containing protein [Helicobacteraceae bacterium]